jgi:IS605 OrfB family transposase
MYITEKHIINKSHLLYKEIDLLCFKSKNLYNKALYTVRQEFINSSKLKEQGLVDRTNYFNYYDINRQFVDSKDTDYYNLPCKVSNQTLMLLDKNFKSFFALCKTYKNNKDSLTGRPKLPGYLHKTKGRFVTTYDVQAISKAKLKLGIIKLSSTNIEVPVINKHNGVLKQVCLVPMSNKKYKIEVIYDVEEKNINLNKDNIISIDYGVNNLMTITSNVEGFQPRIIKGGHVKSINQFYNKSRAELQSQLPNHSTLKDCNGKPRQLTNSNKIDSLTHKRNCKIEHEFHSYSNKIIDLCVQYNVGTIVVGVNKGWKQESNMSKKTNQNFVGLPYTKLTHQLKYKSLLIGNVVVEQEESYTSKASFVDDEVIPVYNKKNYVHYVSTGSRKERGMFVTKFGRRVNSDVNGSYNILRKYMLGISRLLDSSQCLLVPIIIKARVE